MSSLNNDTDVSCAVCVDTSLLPDYPASRIHFAQAVLALHTVGCAAVFALAYRYRRHSVWKGRDPHLLFVFAIGIIACVFTPIREIMGEASTPCAAYYGITYLIHLCSVGSMVVRVLRVLALHFAQDRVEGMLKARDAMDRGEDVRVGSQIIVPRREDSRTQLSVLSEVKTQVTLPMPKQEEPVVARDSSTAPMSAHDPAIMSPFASDRRLSGAVASPKHEVALPLHASGATTVNLPGQTMDRLKIVVPIPRNVSAGHRIDPKPVVYTNTTATTPASARAAAAGVLPFQSGLTSKGYPVSAPRKTSIPLPSTPSPGLPPVASTSRDDSARVGFGHDVHRSSSSPATLPLVPTVRAPIRLRGWAACEGCSTLVGSFVLDYCRLQTVMGQVLAYTVLIIPFLVVFLKTMVSQNAFSSENVGCTFGPSDKKMALVVAGCFVVFQTMSLSYVCRRRDAFYLREELGALFVGTLIFGPLYLFAGEDQQNPLIASSYILLFISWFYAFISFGIPSVRAWKMERMASKIQKTAQNAEKMHLPGSLHASQRASTQAIDLMPDAERTPVRHGKQDLQRFLFSNKREENTDEVMASDGWNARDIAAAQATGTTFQALHRWYALVMVPREKFGGNERVGGMSDPQLSLHRIRDNISDLLTQDPRTYTLPDLERVCVFMVAVPSGRFVLRSLLSREWSMESLLYLVDVAHFRVAADAFAEQWGLVCQGWRMRRMAMYSQKTQSKAFSTSSEVLDSSRQDPMEVSPADRLRAQHEETARLHKMTEAGMAEGLKLFSSARLIFTQYLDASSTMQLSLPSSIPAAVLRRLHALETSWRRVQGFIDSKSPAAENAIRDVTLQRDVEGFVDLFAPVEREVFYAMASGPILRFSTSDEFAAWCIATQSGLADPRDV